MKEKEISVTFFVDKDSMEAFEKAKEFKAEQLGISLTKKQALQLAIKEATENWKQKKSGE